MITRKLVVAAVAAATLFTPSVAFAEDDSDPGIPVPDLPEVELDLTDEDPVDTTSDVPTCHGLVATIVGTDGDDLLVGTRGRDVIVAFGGDDVIRGKGGSDVICAGAGDDHVSGGRGHDAIFGGRGDDRISGSRRGDYLHGGAGDDTIFGRQGRDLIVGGLGDDLLFGNRHADFIKGGVGNDLLSGGLGRPDACHGGPDFDVATNSCEIVVSAS